MWVSECTSAGVKILTMQETTVFVGASFTDCERDLFPPYGNGFVQIIAESGRLPGGVINAGISGNRVIDLVNRWDTDVLAHSPTRVSITIGLNDTWRRYDSNDPTSAEDFEVRYRNIIARTISQTSAEIILCEPVLIPLNPEMESWREDFDPKIQVIHRLAAEYGVKLITFNSFLNAKASERSALELTLDGIHPTRLGHELVAEYWLQAVL